MSTKGLNLPTVTQDQIDAFHQKHFSPAAVDSFFKSFPILPPQQQKQQEHHDNNTTDQAHQEQTEESNVGDEDDDDGLGYYPDGVKRTLTDEQIAMFRHSELEAIKRIERRKLEEAKSRLEEQISKDFGEKKEDAGLNYDDDAGDNDSSKKTVGEAKDEKVEHLERLDPGSGKVFHWPAIAKG